MTENVSRPQPPEHPLSFDVAAERGGAVGHIPLGVRPIRVKRIVGSAGKAEKLGPDFRSLGPGPAEAHYRAILRVMKEGQTLPPITVYQLGPRYFVVDGHTRVAAAKALGIEFIDADVTEYLPRKEGAINLTYYARKEFERNTGLEGVRLTASWRYHLLHHHIEGYRLYLERSLDREVTLPEAARIWYRNQYLPTILAIRKRKLQSKRGGYTLGDVYTDILKDWAEQQGLAVSLREMLDRYDHETKEPGSAIARAGRRMADAVEAALPKSISGLSTSHASSLADADVEAELQGLTQIEQPDLESRSQAPGSNEDGSRSSDATDEPA